MFKKLHQYGANLNLPYSNKQFVVLTETDNPAFENSFIVPAPPAKDQEEKKDASSPEPDYFKGPTLFYMVLMQSYNLEDKVHAITQLVDHGAKFTACDNEGRDVFMHAVIQNDFKLLDALLKLSDKAGVNVKQQDIYGRSAVHYAVNPLITGSYENTSMLKLLNKYKFHLSLKDHHGKTPLEHAKM